MGILFLQQSDAGVQLLLRHAIGAAEDDGGGVFYLVIVELTEVFHIHFAFVGVCHGGQTAQTGFTPGVLDCSYHIAQLTHTRGLNEDPVRRQFSQHLVKGFAEIAYQTTADAAGIHLGNFNAGFL